MTLLGRIIKLGWQRFKREQWVSWSAILVMFISILLITSVFLSNSLVKGLIENIEEQVDITAYFKVSAPEDSIKTLKQNLEQKPEVKSVTYVSRQEALQKFLEQNKQDTTLQQALQEIGENPLPASLNITATNPDLYNQINTYLKQSNFSNLIENIDFKNRIPVINKLQSISNTVETAGIIIGLVLILIAILVTFNTIRLIIYNNKHEISVMRLVGSSNRFIRGPYIVQGVLYGVIAAALAFLTMWIILKITGPNIQGYLGGINLFELYMQDGWAILLIQLLVGIGTGVISSWIAIKKHLHI